MRKGMKLLAAIVAATMLSAMSMTAFGLTYSTETNYSGDTVTVTTTVTAGMADNEEVAYLVYSGTDATKDTIKYIDQKNESEAVNDVLTFSWTDAASKIVEGTKAYVGTASTAAGEGEALELPVLDFVVTYKSAGNGYVSVAATGDAAISGSATVSGEVTFYVFPSVGFVLDKILDGDNEEVGYTLTDGKVTLSFTEAQDLTFTFKADETTETITAATQTDVVDQTNSTVTKYAKATGKVKEAGIIVAVGADAKTVIEGLGTSATTLPGGVYVLPALHVGSDGIYAVRVTDAENIKASNAVYVKSYIKKADGSYAFSAIYGEDALTDPFEGEAVPLGN